MLTGSPSPGGGGGETGTDPAKPTGGGVTPGNPDSPGRTLSFNLELGSGPSRTLITSDKGTPAIGTVSGKTYPLTVTQVPPTAAALTLTVKKTGFLDTTIGPIPISPGGNPPPPNQNDPLRMMSDLGLGGWSQASLAARIKGRTAGRSPRNDPDTHASGPIFALFTCFTQRFSA